ncbi:MAG: excinuclease ABC subunit UvrB, partial [Candidatus Omnitrophica bacterium]|nr:excinuclease ABC subunit UvrB [Candidatus Omnitrophota bacterium]
YVPQTDTYIEKDSAINDEIDRLRLSATSSLMARKDVIIVASVSCIYNLGAPSDYQNMMVIVDQGQRVRRDDLLSWLVAIHYERNDVDFARGKFRVRGDVVEIFPAYRQTAYRVELQLDKVARLREVHPVTGETIADLSRVAVYPAKHFVTTKERIAAALETIRVELGARLAELRDANKLLEAQRLEQRTRFDMEMMSEIGYCHGVENYSRHLSGRPPGSRPSCLLDYFPEEFLAFIDESHVTLPQIRGMHEGDRSRKATLVEYGFRLPSALDNRPLRFEEFEQMIRQVIFASATPGPYELQRSAGRVAEQLIRPTGVVDPQVAIHPTEGQIDDLIARVKERAARKERVLVTTLTKRLSEDLCRYLGDAGLRVKYLHSDIAALERVEILRDLRRGDFDCLIGINLLREGLDLPEVSLVAVLDADQEGFLRSETSLIQVAGRAARNIRGEVVMYADQVTGAMRQAIGEMDRRREKQLAYNAAHHVTATTVAKAIRDDLEQTSQARELVASAIGNTVDGYQVDEVISELQREMELCARNLQFERAAYLRDQMKLLKTNAKLASSQQSAVSSQHKTHQRVR